MTDENALQLHINTIIDICGAQEAQALFFCQRLKVASKLLADGMDIPPAEQYRLEGIGQLLSNMILGADSGGAIFCAAVNQLLNGENAGKNTGGSSEPSPPFMLAEWDQRRPNGSRFLLHITMPTAPVYPS